MRFSLKASGWLVVLAGASVLFVRDVRAGAPLDQYDTFLPGDPFIHDKLTKLYWERFVDAALSLDQAAAVSHCQGSDAGTGWRLPTYKELLTLVDDVSHGEYEGGTIVQKLIDRAAFPGTPGKRFWSSTKSPDLPTAQGYSVDFGTGMAGKEDPATPRLVRCVRDDPPP
jgi:hypothetical protein